MTRLIDLIRPTALPTEVKRMKALARALPAAAGEGVAAILSGSPYLAGLATGDPERLERLLDTAPETSFAALIERLGYRPGESDADLGLRLRRAKSEFALLAGLADCGGVWDLARVTDGLSTVADTALSASTAQALAAAADRGKLDLADPDRPETGCGYFVLGMGKLGAHELNYSSDVDLIAFYDRDAIRVRDADEHQALYVKVTQQLARLMQERQPAGYVFRVDLRLRPDPSSTPLAIATRLAAHYYEAVGQNWERAAYIKARVVAGDRAAGEAFLKEIEPFVWRKYLDFAAIAEVHAMKREIHAVKGHADVKVAGHDLKLGRGGIREIEFFAQTQQLIGGGRDKRLRRRATVDALAALRDAGWIGPGAVGDLTRAYVRLRTLEHRVQQVEDAQTHALPEAPDALKAFARFAGYPTVAAFESELIDTLSTVQSHYARLFETSGGSGRRLVFDADDDRDTLASLKDMGFRAPKAAADVVRGWQAGRVPATRSHVARERLADIAPRLLESFARTENPGETLSRFDDFVGKLPAGVQVFSLLKSNPNLIDLFATIIGTAPRLAAELSRRPRLLDGIIEDLHAPRADPTADMAQRLAVALEDAVDVEDALDRARVFAQEQMFLIGVRLLSGALPPARAGLAFSALGDAVVSRLDGVVTRAFEARHGRTRGGVHAIVALGKFGSREMAATSDLDLLVLYDDPVDAQSDGEKSLWAPEYYTRWTQRLIAALSAPTSKGLIYPVDFRLRPSGNKGPLAVSLTSFAGYHAGEAWTWERMALTRARVVAASAGFAPRVEAAIREAACRAVDPKRVAADAAEMRALMRREKPPADDWDLKLVDGGLVDLDFIAQVLVLNHGARTPALFAGTTAAVLDAARAAGLLGEDEGRGLAEAGRLFNVVTQLTRLCLTEPFAPQRAPRDFSRILCRATDTPDLKRLETALADARAAVRSVFARVVEGRRGT